jgi:xanthine/uracil permease
MCVPMFCPMCNGHAIALQVPVVTITRHATYGPSIAFKLGAIVACCGCSLVSELSHVGRLIDLGNITLEDLECPTVPGIDEPRAPFIQAGSTLLWRRRDS